MLLSKEFRHKRTNFPHTTRAPHAFTSFDILPCIQ